MGMWMHANLAVATGHQLPQSGYACSVSVPSLGSALIMAQQNQGIDWLSCPASIPVPDDSADALQGPGPAPAQ
eukprot:12885911-Prorocentrum_lima.AAC.1